MGIRADELWLTTRLRLFLATLVGRRACPRIENFHEIDGGTHPLVQLMTAVGVGEESEPTLSVDGLDDSLASPLADLFVQE